MKIFRLFFFFLFFTHLAYAQTSKIDSLKGIVAQKNKFSDTIVCATLDKLVKEFHYRGDTLQAIQYNAWLMQEAKDRDNIHYERKGQINEAYIHRETKRVEEKNRIDSLLKVVIKAKDSLIISQCYTYLGNDVLSQNYRDTSRYYFKEALKILEDDYSEEGISALIGLAHTTMSISQDEKPIKILRDALQKAKKIENNILVARILSKLVRFQYFFNQYEEASQLVIEAIQVMEEQQYENYDLIKNYNLLADLYWVKNKDIEKAQFYSQKAFELSKKTTIPPDKKAYFRLCYAYYYIVGEESDYEFAKKLVNKSLNIMNEYNSGSRKDMGHFYLGMIYAAQDSFTQAYPHFIKAIQLSEENDQPYYSLRIQSYLAEEIQRRGLDAPIFIDTTSHSLMTLDSKIWFYRLKKGIAIKNKDFENAVGYLEKLAELRVEEQEEACKIDVEEQLLACKLKEQEEKLTIKEALIQTTTFRNRLLLIVSLLLIGLLGLLYFLYQTKKRFSKTVLEKNEKISKDMIEIAALNEQLNAKIAGIASLNQSLNSKNELLAEKNQLHKKEIVDYIALQNHRDRELKTLQAEINKEIQQMPQYPANWHIIKTRIEKLISNEGDWLHFKRKVESLYPNFFMNLLLKHPNLTEREQMHCAYMAMGMTIKQVAQSIFVSPKAAESARYRLKKKIGLSKADNLVEYIKDMINTEQMPNEVPEGKL